MQTKLGKVKKINIIIIIGKNIYQRILIKKINANLLKVSRMAFPHPSQHRQTEYRVWTKKINKGLTKTIQ